LLCLKIISLQHKVTAPYKKYHGLYDTAIMVVAIKIYKHCTNVTPEYFSIRAFNVKN